jgi:hypothetical protein
MKSSNGEYTIIDHPIPEGLPKGVVYASRSVCVPDQCPPRVPINFGGMKDAKVC